VITNKAVVFIKSQERAEKLKKKCKCVDTKPSLYSLTPELTKEGN
jgi:hypothetical protein